MKRQIIAMIVAFFLSTGMIGCDPRDSDHLVFPARASAWESNQSPIKQLLDLLHKTIVTGWTPCFCILTNVRNHR